MLVLQQNCSYAVCSRRAVVSVFNTFNEHQGCFCQKHGKLRVAALNRAEAAMVSSTIADRRSA